MTVDPHSFARPYEVRVTHASLDLTVDFERTRIHGRVHLTVERAPGAGRLVLDSRALEISAVFDEAERPLAWTLGPEDAVLGRALEVQLGDATRAVVIAYATASDAPALQWLSPAQTAGGARPFLFTQGHAILSRSWLPIQDSPGIRFTYDARIAVPPGLVAVMSAERLDRVELGIFSFRMREPVPAYLVALAVGDLAMRAVGERTGVWAEPATLDRAAHEFAELERMLAAAEALVGPYRWGRFDVLVMPPSFPYGGMENPRLVFASPTLLAGDRSLTTVVVHELAHAWAGNLVTNATWADFWLNEGTTVYLELRLNEALWGADRADLLRGWSFRELSSEIARSGATPDTRLRYDLTGRDPAEGVTVIPYLKGAAFFWTLEALVGRPRLDAFLRGWFEAHAFGAVTTDDLGRALEATLFADGEPRLDLATWFDAPGMPDVPAPRSTILDRVDALGEALARGDDPRDLDVEGLTPAAWRQLLTGLAARDLDAAALARIDAAFALSARDNAEVLTPWLRLLAKARVDAAVPRIEGFLRQHGRAKVLRPVFAELLASPWGAPIARRLYDETRPRHHALVRGVLDRLFALHGSSAVVPS